MRKKWVNLNRKQRKIEHLDKPFDLNLRSVQFQWFFKFHLNNWNYGTRFTLDPSMNIFCSIILYLYKDELFLRTLELCRSVLWIGGRQVRNEAVVLKKSEHAGGNFAAFRVFLWELSLSFLRAFSWYNLDKWRFSLLCVLSSNQYFLEFVQKNDWI